MANMHICNNILCIMLLICCLYIHIPYMHVCRSIYVAGFGKMCIVHTSSFAHLEIHKNYMEWYTDLKLSEKIKVRIVVLYNP